MKRTLVWILIAVFANSIVGCARPESPVWNPPPPVKWDDIATGAPVPVDNGFLLFENELSHGRFPATIAVSRVSIHADEPVTGVVLRTPYLAARPRNEFLLWNSTFDDLMAISEVFPIAQRDLGGESTNPSRVLAASRALHGRLALIYAMNEISETETEMVGVLYETADDKPIAVIHARAESIVVDEDQKGGDKAQPNEWETDSRALVRARFARLAHGCIRELVRRDRRESIEDKSGWIPSRRFVPIEWPPNLSSPSP